MWRVSSRMRARWFTADSTSPRLRAVRETVKVPGPGGPPSAIEVALDENLDAVLELEQVAEKRHVVPAIPHAASQSRSGMPARSTLPVHLQMALFVRELEQRGLLELVEGRVAAAVAT